MRLSLLTLTLALPGLVACSPTLPEGQYVCTDPTDPSQCPDGWRCVDNRCVSQAGDAGPDAGERDAGDMDGGGLDGGGLDGGGLDGGVPDGGELDAGPDAGPDGGLDAGTDGGPDAGLDAGSDAGFDAAVDGGMPGRLIWSRVIGGTGPTTAVLRDRARAIAVRPDGGLLVVGDTNSDSIDFGTGMFNTAGSDAFVATYTRDGGNEDAFRLGGGSFDEGRAAAVADGELVAGGRVIGSVDFGTGSDSVSTTNGFVARYSGITAATNTSVARINALSTVTAVAPIGERDVIAVGNFNTPPSEACVGGATSGGAGHMFVVRLNASGVVVWCVAAEGSVNSQANGVTVDSSGNVVVIGGFTGTMTIGTLSYAAEGVDALVFKLDGATGAVIWATPIGGTDTQEGIAVAALPGEEVLVTGSYTGSATTIGGSDALPGASAQTAYLARLNAVGGLVWRRVGVLSMNSRGWALATDALGNAVLHGEHSGIALGGCSASSVDGSTDIFVARIDPSDGTCMWLASVGGPDEEAPGGVALDGSRVYVAASVNDGAVVGMMTVATAGDDGADDHDTDIALFAYEL